MCQRYNQLWCPFVSSQIECLAVQYSLYIFPCGVIQLRCLCWDCTVSDQVVELKLLCSFDTSAASLSCWVLTFVVIVESSSCFLRTASQMLRCRYYPISTTLLVSVRLLFYSLAKFIDRSKSDRSSWSSARSQGKLLQTVCCFYRLQILKSNRSNTIVQTFNFSPRSNEISNKKVTAQICYCSVLQSHTIRFFI